MRPSLPTVSLFASLLAFSGVLAGAVGASPEHLVAADPRGVTIAIDVPAWTLGAAGPDGRAGIVVSGLAGVALPGRPQLPYVSALIALPPGARATARVLATEGATVREGVRLAINPKPGFRDGGGPLGVVPTLEEVPPITGALWPASEVEVGETVTVRGHRLAVLRVYPFRYEEGEARLTARSRMIVRVEFAGGTSLDGSRAPAAEDRHWDSVLENAVLNYEQGRGWREARPQATRLSGRSPLRESGVGTPFGFDESEPEVRVKIDSTGVYALPFTTLATNGYPTGVPIDEVSVHRHEFIEGAVPSYGTLELPIEVDDANTNDVFDAGDRIVLFVQDWAARSRASGFQRTWGNAEVVYATRLTGRTGLRVATRSGSLGAPLAPLSSYPYTGHWEQNREYLRVFQAAETDTNTDQWHWTSIGAYSLPDSFNFEINDLDSSHPALFTIMWQGFKREPHVHWAHVRNPAKVMTALIDSLVWPSTALRSPRVGTATVPGTAIGNGPNNVLRTWGWTNAAREVVLAGVNWFEVGYWRGYKSLNGYLSANSAGASGDFQVHATNFGSAGIRVYDVSDSLNPVRVTLDDSLIVQVGSRWVARFRDQSPTGVSRSYIVFDTPKSVPAGRYSAVARRNLAERGHGDYLLIVPEAFLPAVGRLDSLRTAQGLDVVVAPLEAINDEFNGGRHSAHSIRRFIRHAYNEWNAKFVLLVGDGSEDPLNYYVNSGIDWIPAPKVPGPVFVYDGASNVYEAIPSDPWYVYCLNCVNPPGDHHLHDLMIGRLPVNSVEEAQAVVQKLIRYEIVDPSETWRRKMVLTADDLYSTQTFVGNPLPDYCRRYYEVVFREISENIRSVILNEAGLAQSEPEVFDLQAYLSGVPVTVTGTDTCRNSLINTQLIAHTSVTPRLIDRLNEGRLWWNYQGHANQFVLSHEDFWVNRSSNDDHFSLLNEDKLFFFSAFSCHPNGFALIGEAHPAQGPSLGEDLVTLPSRGAVASWGSSGFEILPGNGSNHLNLRLARAMFSNPPQDPYLGDRGARAILGEIIKVAILRNVDSVSSTLEQDVGISYILLGDPATRLSIGGSQIIVTANGTPVVDGEPVRLFALSDTLQLEADIVSNVRVDSIWFERTDGSGTVVIPPAQYSITPAFPDTLPGGRGGRQYHLSYRAELTLGSYRYTIHAIDRNGVPSDFDIVFEYQTVLRADGVPLRDDDKVSPTADLSIRVVSPSRLIASDFAINLNGMPQTATATPAPSDTSGREWIVRWNHGPYAPGSYVVEVVVQGVVPRQHRFQVESTTALQNVMAFPNPFDDERGTVFSYYLTGSGPTDLLLRVFTISGKLVYERTEHGQPATYGQIAWDGRDAEGDKLANGTYFYRLLAKSGGIQAMHEGKLVKLRRPRRSTTSESP